MKSEETYKVYTLMSLQWNKRKVKEHFYGDWWDSVFLPWISLSSASSLSPAEETRCYQTFPAALRSIQENSVRPLDAFLPQTQHPQWVTARVSADWACVCVCVFNMPKTTVSVPPLPPPLPPPSSQTLHKAYQPAHSFGNRHTLFLWLEGCY